MDFDKNTQINLLYDFYGELLSPRQNEVMMLYYGDDLSLSEIATELSISKQGVHDALKNAANALNKYENKLHLVDKFRETRNSINCIDNKLNELLYIIQDSDILDKLNEIKDIIGAMEE